jgi:hypothetical protein
MFNHSIFKKNLLNIKTKISNSKYLMKKKRLVFSKRAFFSKYSVFFNKKRLLKILKDNIMTRLFLVHNFDDVFIKTFSIYAPKYIFINIKKIIKMKKYSYLSKQS